MFNICKTLEKYRQYVQYEAYGPILLSSLFNHIINTITPKLFSTKEVSNGSLLSFQRFNT